jgi:ABC-2 type transport system ATP-binding protein
MLAARDLSVRYRDGVRAIERISLSVPQGSIVGLLGPNAAGKSTLLRVLATLQRPDEGAVTVCGVDALRDPNAARRHIGYLPQDFGFPPALTAAELLGHFALLKGFLQRAARLEAVHTMLQRVNLWSERDRAVKTLSGGMKQRLGIAVALIGAPDVIIIDEPTVALDPTERQRVYDLLAELAEHRAVLLSTHIVADVEALCRDIVILNHGRIARAGRSAELCAALRGRLYRARLGRGDALAMREQGFVIREALIGGAVEVSVLSSSAPDARFVAAEPTLDDVFAEATRA